MNTTTINDAETARKVADKIVTLMTSITEQESAQERELNAVAARYATVIDTLKAELKELQAAFLKYLKKAANQKALFDEGNRSGHSTLRARKNTSPSRSPRYLSTSPPSRPPTSARVPSLTSASAGR